MDGIDTQILMELTIDAQLSFLEISKKLGISRETVRKRFDKMKKDGTIKLMSILIDAHKIGDQGAAFLMLTCARGANKKAIFQKLQILTGVCLVTQLMGDFDFFVWARVINMQQLAQLLNSIKEQKEIDKIEPMLLQQTYFSFSLIPKVSIKCDNMDLTKRT
jgi:DNA-binding Lrp family transcriptional regulator